MNCCNDSLKDQKSFGFKKHCDDFNFKHIDKAFLGLSFLGGLLFGVLISRRPGCYPANYIPYTYTYPFY